MSPPTTPSMPPDLREGPEPPDAGLAARLPDIPGPLETLGLLWRRLRRMSTALLLLFAVAAAAIIATFVPQEPIIARTVADWRSGAAGPGTAVSEVFDALGFYDVFGSLWFNVLLVLLFTSLTGCLVPRYRAFAKVVRRPPDPGRNLSRLSSRVVLRTELDPAAAADAVEAVLRRRRFRRRRLHHDGATRLAAERGHRREGGSLVFHTSFYLLLVGVVWGQLFGFTGQINIEEGHPFAETALIYDLRQPGRLWDVEDHRGFVVTLEDFDVSYFDDLTPADYVSTITISGPGREPVTEQVRVNHPVSYEGMNIYQARFGMAPVVVLRNTSSGEELFRGQVMMNDAGGSVWSGVAKVSLGGSRPDGSGGTTEVPQVALDLVFVPDGALVNRDGNVEVVPRGPEVVAPKLLADLYIGEDLGLDRNVPAAEFDRSGGPLGDTALLEEGDVVPLAGGLLELAYEDTTMWSGFQVSHQPGRWLLLLAGVLVLTGLVPSLYSYRRRIWAEIRPLQGGGAHPPDGHVEGRGGGSEVVLAGVALQRRERFDEEFAAIAASAGAALDAGGHLPAATPQPHPRTARHEDTA